MTPELEQLATLLESHDLTRLEYERGDVRVVMERSAASCMQQQVQQQVQQRGPSPHQAYPQAYPLPQGAEPWSAGTATGPTTGTVAGSAASTATGTATQTASPLAPVSPNTFTVTAPLVGVVYRSREPGAAPFVECGQRVAKGDVLCLIEAMKLFNEITAPTTGVISAVLFEDGTLAEYGAPLITIDTEPAPTNSLNVPTSPPA